MRVAYFHEDDYCQLEAVPGENLQWCLDQCRSIDEFADAHRDGAGWTDMYVRPSHQVELAARGITVEALTEALQPHLPPYDAVSTGYSTHVEELPGAIAFGVESNVVVFASHRDGVVSAIWFTLQPADEAQVETATAALRALAGWSLLLVDWGWSRVIPMNDEDAIRGYLRERVRVFTDLAAQFERKRNASWLTRLRNWIRR